MGGTALVYYYIVSSVLIKRAAINALFITHTYFLRSNRPKIATLRVLKIKRGQYMENVLLVDN